MPASPSTTIPPLTEPQDSVLNPNAKAFATDQSIQTPLTRFLALNNSSDILQPQSQDQQPAVLQQVHAPSSLTQIHNTHHSTHPQTNSDQNQTTHYTQHSISSQTNRSTTQLAPQARTPLAPAPPNPPSQQAFPTGSTRQRSSNVNTENPLQEFQKTALEACRSTITQQEVEIKRLKEGMDIRNKRILQLESQIGHAADFIATRDNPKDSPETTNSILERIASIESKLTCMMQLQHPPNNIVINPCLSSSHLNKQSQTVATQTEAAPIESDGCSVTIPLTQSVPDVCSPQSLNNSEPTVCDNSTSQAPASL